MYKQERYLFRAATEEDIRELAAIEKICFSENEACSYEEVKDRVEKIPEDFLIAFDQVNKKIAGYMSGIHSGSEVFLDEFFRNASLHEKGAKHCFLLGLEVRPEYQGKGLATQIMNRYIDMEEKWGTEKIFLTCHTILFLSIAVSGMSTWESLPPPGEEKAGRTWCIEFHKGIILCRLRVNINTLCAVTQNSSPYKQDVSGFACATC